MFTAKLVGNFESLILLFKAVLAWFARIFRSLSIGVKEQFFADIVKPRCNNVGKE